MLNRAEAMYGPRDKDFTILGVEIAEISQPQIWFPGDCGHVAIQLTPECLHDSNLAMFQAAHEIVHCLCPRPGRASVLEEGAATFFSIEYIHKNNIDMEISDKKYVHAFQLYSDLHKLDPELIKKARQEQPSMSLMTEDLLVSLCPDLKGTELLRNLLCEL